MKILAATLLIALAATTHANGPAWLTPELRAKAYADGVQWQSGRCAGGLQPSSHCTNCTTCWYCGKHGRHGSRPKNSATCWVCENR